MYLVQIKPYWTNRLLIPPQQCPFKKTHVETVTKEERRGEGRGGSRTMLPQPRGA